MVNKKVKMSVNKKLNVPLRMRIIYAGDRIEFITGYHIDMVKCDEQGSTIKGMMYKQLIINLISIV